MPIWQGLLKVRLKVRVQGPRVDRKVALRRAMSRPTFLWAKRVRSERAKRRSRGALCAWRVR
jgi:hypothetical protein